jgi:dipeptidyl aminopeptidase/acylaminoacyl peptidase
MTQKVALIGESLPCEVRLFDIGGAPAFVYLPTNVQHSANAARSLTPWVWYAPTFVGGNPSHENAWLFKRWLDEGFAIAGVEVGESYGNPVGRDIFTAFHSHLVSELGFSLRAVLHPQSRGGLMLYNWAAEHPESVACVLGIYTVCDLRSYPGLETAAPAYGMTTEQLEAVLSDHNPVDRLAPLVAHDVPILHIHGDSDEPVPIEANSGELVRRYRELGGDAQVIIVPGKGHAAIPEYFEREELAEFVIRLGIQ